MIIVLDACAANAVIRGLPEGEFFERHVTMEDEVISTTQFISEIANIQWKYVRTNAIDMKLAAMRAFTAAEMVDRFIDVRDLYIEALNEGVRLNHSVYDMFYLVLARRTGGTLFTMDKALARLCIAEGVACVCSGVTEELA